MSDDPNIVWTQRIDETYPVTVTRTAPYLGLLQVWADEAKSAVIHQQSVGLMYDAMFGPDMDDVNEWMNVTTDVIDNPEKREVPE